MLPFCFIHVIKYGSICVMEFFSLVDGSICKCHCVVTQKVDNGEVGVARMIDVGHCGENTSAQSMSLHEFTQSKPEIISFYFSIRETGVNKSLVLVRRKSFLLVHYDRCHPPISDWQ